MSARGPRLLVQSAPFLHPRRTTPALMNEVTLVALTVLVAATWFFGVSAVLVVAAATLGAVATEWALGRRPRGSTLRDGSAVLTGILLGLTLPPGVPLWIAAVGGAVAIGLGKLVWGGLGHNPFNPALVGRAFLQAAFPSVLTTWQRRHAGADLLSVEAASLAPPLLHADVDAVSAATPLARMRFDGEPTPLLALLTGDTAGSLGETSALLLIACGLWLGLRRAFDWRIPVAILLSVAVASGALFAVQPDRFGSPPFMLLSGGLLFGAVFMATDPVSSPTTPAGAWLFGAGVGLLVVLIRQFGGLPEGVMYAILLMNAATPLIERVTQPRPFGRRRSA